MNKGETVKLLDVFGQLCVEIFLPFIDHIQQLFSVHKSMHELPQYVISIFLLLSFKRLFLFAQIFCRKSDKQYNSK